MHPLSFPTSLPRPVSALTNILCELYRYLYILFSSIRNFRSHTAIDGTARTVLSSNSEDLFLAAYQFAPALVMRRRIKPNDSVASSLYSYPPERLSSSVGDTFAAFTASRLAQIIYIT
ncbi:hypothetical protein NA56DRAFT_708758 [Hyaloscypha hepaticicola]|uniref:Uncharacterized protein n=1 Tax=Hyaloscypha hepaticicola TaxID=2082293 RepID=A0A2J6PR72_9HELO|nr:hypothetical protein NA56DRAFT_708758 [Hyaloscypha hepaticicola]